MPSAFTGKCACGQVKYESSEPPIVQLICHCRDCQRASGGSGAALAIDRLNFTAAQPKYYSVTARSGRTMRRGFCQDCGSPISIRRPETPMVEFIHAASLDNPSSFAPSCEVWVSSAETWHQMHPVAQKFETDPSPEAVRDQIRTYFAARSSATSSD